MSMVIVRAAKKVDSLIHRFGRWLLTKLSFAGRSLFCSARFATMAKTGPASDPSPAPGGAPPVSEDEKVLWWRAGQLLDADYSLGASLLLAHTDVDLHRAISLLQSGCPEEKALEILL